MYRMRWLAVLTTLALAACGDAAAPGNPPPQTTSDALHALRWAPGASPRTFGGVSTQPGGEPARAFPDAPTVLSTQLLRFWAYATRDASGEVFYLASDSTWQPYVSLLVPSGSLLRRPDGTLFAPGDSIEITMAMDTALVLVDLEPTGLYFNPLIPAKFNISYSGSNPDYNGDGLVNFLDTYIEQWLMGLWVRRYPSDPWESVGAIESLLGKLFSADLRHFSEYAVSW